MREIDSRDIIRKVRDAAITAACDLEPDILEALLKARDNEDSPLPKSILELLLSNADIASRERIPVCQDTGVAVLFVSLGQDVHVSGDLENAIQEGIRQGYADGYLRNSVCDPLTRKNTGTNTPAVVHFELVPGDSMVITLLPKGCGSENMCALRMLPPSSGREGVVNFVTSCVFEAGSNPCPPVVVGVGLGGTFEKAAVLSKKALLRPVGSPNEREDLAQLEKEILGEINDKGQGVHGFGGSTTALAVQIEAFPSHIASLPVAVNIQCHAHRYKRITL